MTLSTADPGSLLSAPLTPGVRAEGRQSRPNTEALGYENTSKQFKIDNTSKNYNSQFYKVCLKNCIVCVVCYYLYFQGVQCEAREDATSHN